MPRDRQTWRTLIVSIGLFCSTVSNGCLTSSFVRSGSATAPNSTSASTPDPANRAATVPDPGSGPVSLSPNSPAPPQRTAMAVGGGQVSTPAAFPLTTASQGPDAAALQLQGAPVAGDPAHTAIGTGGTGEPNATSDLDPAAASRATPMLDAAIKRVADVTEQQRESRAADTLPNLAETDDVTPVPSRSAGVVSSEPKAPIVSSLAPTGSPTASSAPPTPPSAVSSPPAAPPSAVSSPPPTLAPTGSSLPPTPSAAGSSLPPTPSPTGSSGQRSANESSQDNSKLLEPPLHISVVVDPPSPALPAVQSSSPDATTAEPSSPALLPASPSPQPLPKEAVPKPGELARERMPDSGAGSHIPDQTSGADHRIPLTINEFRLCRSVTGFGSFEPLNGTTLKAGQRILIYWELAGLEYEATGAGFASRISSRIELRLAGGGPVEWEKDLGAAEDVCRRRRQDYYVNYRVDLPRSLPPGSYHLRLVQTDLVAIRSTSAEIPIEIGD
jgi:hypothetical protein